MEVGGVVQPGNRFVSFVRASGRGEAKLRGRARGDESPVARAPAGPVRSAVRPGRSWPGCPACCPVGCPAGCPAVACWVVPSVVPWDVSCQLRAG